MVLLPLLVAGCATSTIAPHRAYLPQEPVYSDHDWVLVLRNHVRDGWVDYDGLAADREPLDRFYALLSVTGPSSTPEQFSGRTEKIAYWINAYNALVLVAVLQRYPVSTMYDLALPSLEYEYTFTVDGRKTTLMALEEAMLANSDRDVRSLFALCAAAAATPQLRGEPYRADTLDDDLDRAARRALDNPQICQINHAARTILVWQKILQHNDDFIVYWQLRRRSQTAYLYNILLDMASPERRQVLQSAVGYTFAAMPFDRTLNRYPSASSPAEH